MSLNIKDPEAHRLAQELARETGETMTSAVTEALKERLARVRKKHKTKSLASDLCAIGRRYSKHLRTTPVDHAQLLYDERGLPK